MIDTRNIKVIRSRKRVKTVSARMIDDQFVVRAPATMPDEELALIVNKLKARFEKREQKEALDDAALHRRAQHLNKKYFGGQLQWQSIKWVTNQNGRFGSCTPSQGTIRLSHGLATMPVFVRDYVIVHELAHLLEPNHGLDFWRWVNRYPRTERARGYLMAVGLEKLEE